ALQDELTLKVAASLGAYEGRVAETDRARAKQKHVADLNAYELVLLAREQRHRWDKEGVTKAKELLEQAVALDPQYARVHVGLAWTHLIDVLIRTSETPDASTKLAYDSAMKAIELDDSLADGYWVLASILISAMQEHEKGIAAFERALALNPNHADILADWGGYYMPALTGKAEEGIELVKKAMRLSPFHDDWYEASLALAYFVARRYEEVITTLRSVGTLTINRRQMLAASYAFTGRLEEARKEVVAILEMQPDSSLGAMDKKFFLTDAELAHVREGLRMAGLPE
ncbi:MAG: hypothetical protein OEN20_01795, partial [Gammaproteobacteria bacterium]|nr:hypothetical protein [Gammaproteobacteria bacterium]